uniref:T-box transcription factor 16, like n=1 Tax=Sinocyclocheilus anshuiensis TaxID=1608454 RepID=A0A671LZY9_9TELE
MYLPEERPVLDLPYKMNHLLTCWTQHGLNGRMNSPEAELTSLPVHVSLQDRKIWDKFSSIGTEMLITKSGRRMFPSCKVTVTGLNPKIKYVVIMDMVLFDNHKYKWNKDLWEMNDSPAPGEKWMQYPISFHKLKLTNNTLNSNGLVVLHSIYLRFTFPEAAFIAVTAYQNQEITKLKIDNNPFAKGFRDNGLNRKRLDRFVLQNNGVNFFASPREARPSSLHSLCAALPVAQSSCVQSSTGDGHLSTLPSQISSPLNPQQHNHHSSPASQTPGRSIIQLQPCFRTPPHPSRQCPDMELPLPLPPKLSCMQLPGSALRNLEMTPVSDYVRGPRPLTNILNRIHFRTLVSGPSGKVLQNPPQPEQYLRGSDRELHPQIYPAVQKCTDQQFTLNSMLNIQTEHRSQMDYVSARPLTEYYSDQQTGK